MCKVKGPTFLPSAVTMNGTRCDDQAGNEGNIAAEPIELCNGHRSLVLLRGLRGCLELGTLQQRISAFPCLNLSVFRGNVETFSLGECGDAARCASRPRSWSGPGAR